MRMNVILGNSLIPDVLSFEEVLTYEYEDTKSGTIIKFNKFDHSQFKMIKEFQEHLCD